MDSIKYLPKRKREITRQPSCTFSEIILTEYTYIMGLSEIVNKYIPETTRNFSECVKQLPDNLKIIKPEQIFGNIKAIYEWHKNDFLTILKRCKQEPHKFGTKIEEIENTMLGLYVEYFKNKQVSDHIVSILSNYFAQVSNKFGHEFQIQELLRLPIDRIFKYKILFLGIQKDMPQYERELKTAIKVLERIIAGVNNLMVLWQLTNFPENIDDQGKLICLDPLFFENKTPVRIWRLSRVPYTQLQVFLLEESIIFANIIGEGNSFNSVTFKYEFHIKVRHLRTVEMENDKIRLNIKNKDEKKETIYYIYSKEKGTNEKWLDAIISAMENKEKFLGDILVPCRTK